MDFGKIGKVHYLLVLLAGILIVYSYFFSFLDNSYAPYYGDEHFYFKNSESFYLTNNLEASFTYSGAGSLIFGADAHGPMYPLIYGSIAKVVGWGGMVLPLINLSVLILAILALLLNRKSVPETKLLQTLLIFGSPISLFYSLTYLPELLQVAGAIGLYLLMSRYITTEKTKDFVLLLLFILLLGSIRSTWFFALFGLLILPGPIKGFAKSLYLFLGLALPFLYQYFLHEQVPNTFSGLGEVIKERGLLAASEVLHFNFKRNIYFIFHYTEGYFYTLQKVWVAATLVYTLIFYRKEKIMMSGLLILAISIVFNLILYKNYSWVDLRMYSPMCFFLNLGMLQNQRHGFTSTATVGINLISFLLVLPLQNTLIHYRISPEVSTIPDQVLEEIENLEKPLVLLDSAILYDYSISQLPVLTKQGELIRYILPYYEMEMELPSHSLREQNGQLSVPLTNILSQ